jgi:predicted nucleotide-binding protein
MSGYVQTYCIRQVSPDEKRSRVTAAMHEIILSINNLTDAVSELPQTNAPLETMVERGIDRGKYDATVKIRENLDKVVNFLRPFASVAAEAAFAEIPQAVSDAIGHDLRKLFEIAKEVPIKCQLPKTSAVPPAYHGKEAATAQLVDHLPGRVYQHLSPLTVKLPQEVEHEPPPVPSNQMETQKPMTDAQMRTRILEWFYQHRSEPDCRVYPSTFPGMLPVDISRICDQLKSQGLIDWKTPRGSIVGIGFGRIIASGSNQIEHAVMPTHSAIDQILSKKVFIVHGHDSELKESTAHLVSRLGLEPIILHREANKGRTIIEKFTDHADQAGFAIVLLTPDDEGRSREMPLRELQPRARQNVVLEMGFFFGKLGRGRVCAILKPGVERPSDTDGILYVEHDPAGRWQFDVAKEIKEAGYVVNFEKI